MVQVLERSIDNDILEKIHAFVYHGEESQSFSFIGAGKNADVFKVNGTQVAIKKFYKDAWDSKDHIPLSILQGSKYYPKLYAYDPSKYMVMELVDGKTIYEIEKTDYLLYKDYYKELQRAAIEAKSRGLYTNDVHLNNIMIQYDGNIKIVDVGRFTLSPTTHDQLLNAASSSPPQPWTGTRYIPGQGTWRP